MSISTNGASSINVSMEVNGTTYSGEQKGFFFLFVDDDDESFFLQK